MDYLAAVQPIAFSANNKVIWSVVVSVALIALIRKFKGKKLRLLLTLLEFFIALFGVLGPILTSKWGTDARSFVLDHFTSGVKNAGGTGSSSVTTAIITVMVVSAIWYLWFPKQEIAMVVFIIASSLAFFDATLFQISKFYVDHIVGGVVDGLNTFVNFVVGSFKGG